MKLCAFRKIDPRDWFFKEHPAVALAVTKATASPDADETSIGEYVRQWVIHELITTYGYPREWLGKRIVIGAAEDIRCTSEQTTVGINNERGKPFLVIETTCRALAEAEFARTQSRLQPALARTPTANVGLVTDGTPERSHVFVKKPGPDGFDRAADIPPYDENRLKYGLRLIRRQPSDGVDRGRTGLTPLSAQDVDVLFKCHSVIRDIDGLHPDECLDELCKLIYAKIWDERNTVSKADGAAFAFQAFGGNVEEIASNIRDLYQEAIHEDLRLFGQRIPSYERSRGVFRTPIRLSSPAIVGVVEILQDYSLVDSSADIKGMAFQQLLGPAIRAGMGQYFTPEPVVQMVVAMIKPTHKDLILDPFCGSARFLTEALAYVLRHYKDCVDVRELQEFAFFRLHGIEKSDRMVRIAMTDMLLYDDGHSNIRHTDALLSFDNYPDIQALGEGENACPEVFDLVLTNPPFGSLVPVEVLQARGRFELAAGKDIVPLEALGLERSVQFLQPGGGMAIVLPESILNTRQMAYVRDFVLSRTKVLAVVSLPPQTFMPFQGVGKASVLFLRKCLPGERLDEDYDVFVAIAHHVGYDSTNRRDPRNDLPEIVDAFTRFQSRESQDLGKLCFVIPARELRRTFSAVSLRPVNSRSPWPTKPLGDLIVDVFNGATPPRDKYTDSGHRILKVRDLTGEGLNWDPFERAFVDRHFFAKHKRRRVLIGDILSTAAAHHPSYIGKKVDIVDYVPEEHSAGVLATAELMVIRVDAQKIDPYYVLLYLRTEEGYRAMQSCVTGQTAHLYPEDVCRIRIPMPPGERLNEINSAIDALRESLQLRREFKKARDNASTAFGSLFEIEPPACDDVHKGE